MFIFSSRDTFQCKKFPLFFLQETHFRNPLVLLQKPFKIKQRITTQLYHRMLFVPCLLGSVGKTATKGFSCIYSPELVCRSPNWPSRGNAWKRSILIPWGGDGKEIGVVCSPWKPLDHGRWSHHVGQEPLVFLKRRWIKMASTVKEEWRRNRWWGSRAEPSDIRKFQHGISNLS